jgi:ADP-heptose:LPS heptosyltransferase
MTDYLAPIGSGIGDLLVSLPAVQALIDSDREVVLLARSPAQEELAERIAGLRGAVAEEGLGGVLSPGDRSWNLRDHPLQRDWWWGSPEFEEAFGGIRIDEIVARIARDLGFPLPVSDQGLLVPLRARIDPGLRATTLLVPATDAAPKLWPESSWRALAAELIERSRPVEMIGPDSSAPVRALREAGIPWRRTETLGEVVDRVSSSAAVVAVDTGFFHLAVQQGIPAVGLFRPGSVFRRAFPHARSLCASECDPACIAADSARAHNRSIERVPQESAGWRCVRPESGSCMARIEVARVLDALGGLRVVRRGGRIAR